MSPGQHLRGRTALITGGSPGIGAATARTLASLGAAVVVTYRNERTTAEDLAARLRAEHGVAACAVMFDLTAADQEPAGAGELLDVVSRTVGNLDILLSTRRPPIRR
jgi:NAD(P)-dependent dehydrogenase (short-subunit alcohol dehydrogenase family)